MVSDLDRSRHEGTYLKERKKERKRPTGLVLEHTTASQPASHSVSQPCAMDAWKIVCTGISFRWVREQQQQQQQKEEEAVGYSISLLSIYSPPSAALKGSSMGKAGQKGLEAKSFKTEHMT